VVVVLYLRDPFRFLLSTYSQVIKTGGHLGTFEEWIDAHHTGRYYDGYLPYRYLDRMYELATRHNCDLRVFRYEDADGPIAMHFLEVACGVSVEGLTIPDREMNLSLTAFDCSFHRGLNFGSARVGRLLGWERTDTQLVTSRLSSGEPGRFELSRDGVAKLSHLCDEYRKVLLRCTDFADRVDFSIDRRHLTERYTDEEAGIHRKFYELGQIVAQSCSSGYIDWDFKKRG